ncbi:MAG TPA: dUTP diphosphatase [Candidatus Paceibacterota bacterium]|nr:dUTP diphosphatase [Candidatus Paceibacterota bacterium]
MTVVVKIRRLAEEVKLPSYAYPGDAAFDLCAREDVSLSPGEYRGIPTGLAMEIPEGYVGLVWDKSGVGIKNGLKTLGGVVDCNYRGEVVVGLANLSGETRNFKRGEKVAQMIIQKKEEVILEDAQSLSETVRGEKGFGSSGK